MPGGNRGVGNRGGKTFAPDVATSVYRQRSQERQESSEQIYPYGIGL